MSLEKEKIKSENIQTLSSTDYEAWCDLIDTTWPGLPHTLEHDFIAIVENSQTSSAVFKDGQMIGASYNTLHLDQGNIYLYVHMIGVPKAHQNQGVGTNLMKQNLELIKNHQSIIGMRLTSDPLDTRNVRLYLNHSCMTSSYYKLEAYNNLGETGGDQHKNLPSDRLLYQYVDGSPWSISRVLPSQDEYQKHIDNQPNSLIASSLGVIKDDSPVLFIKSLLDLEESLKINPLEAQQTRQFHRQVLPLLFSKNYTAVDQTNVETINGQANCIVLLKDFDLNNPDCLIQSIN